MEGGSILTDSFNSTSPLGRKDVIEQRSLLHSQLYVGAPLTFSIALT